MINLIKALFAIEPKSNAIAESIEIKEMPAKSLWS